MRTFFKLPFLVSSICFQVTEGFKTESRSLPSSLIFLQLDAMSGENKRLRRQLEQERSMRLFPPRPPPPASQQCSPSPLSHYVPLSLLNLESATTGRILAQTELSRAGLERQGEFQALGESVATFLEEAGSGI